MKKFIDKNCFWHNNKDKERVVKELEDLIARETERCAMVVDNFNNILDKPILDKIAKSIRDKQ